MQKKFLGNLILLLFLNFLIKPFWIFGIDRTVQNIVGTEQYGLYYALFNFSFLFNIFLDFGITNFNNRNIAQNHFLVKKHFPNIVGLKISLGILYAIITLISGLILGYNNYALKLLSLLILNQFLISLTLYLRSNISGLQLFKTDSLLSATDRFLMILFCGFLLFFKKDAINIEWFIYCQSAAYFVTFLAAFFAVIKHSSFSLPKLNVTFSLSLIKQSIPFALLILLMTLYNKVDTVMLQKLLPNGNYHSGLYAQGYRLFEASTMIAYLFASLLLPMFSKMIKNKESVKELTILSTNILLCGAITIALCLSIFNKEIIALLYKDTNTESYNAFSFLILGLIPVSTSYIFGTLLTANGSLKQLNFLALSSMILNIILNLILIPKLKAEGAAMASLITQSISAVFQIVLAIKLCNLTLKFSVFLRLLFLTAIVLLAAFVCKSLFDFKTSIITTIIVGGISSMLLKIININELKKLLLQPQQK